MFIINKVFLRNCLKPHLIILLYMSLLLVGCREITSHMNYSELKEYKAEMNVDGEKLVIKLDNLLGLTVVSFDHIYKDGNIYIGAHRVSGGEGRIYVYEIDLSQYDLPDDFRKRIYWVNSDGTVELLYPEYLK